jgi:hypothetical protein
MLPFHRYYEGYFHGQNTPHDVKTLNPRLGVPMTKQAAPLPLRALCEAVRRQITPSLLQAIPRDCAPENEIAALVAQLLRDGCAFSDLAIQVRHERSMFQMSHQKCHFMLFYK